MPVNHTEPQIGTVNPGFVTEERAGVLIIRFDRPEIRSPLSIHVIEGISFLLDDARDLKTIIFTGTLDVFASGADLREVAEVTGDRAREFAIRGQTLMSQIASASALTVAVVNGYCFGGALDLALACSYRIASANAVFSHPGTGLGIITGWGGTQRLPRLIGRANALEMLFTSLKVNAEEALRIGLVDRIVESPLTAALSMA